MTRIEELFERLYRRWRIDRAEYRACKSRPAKHARREAIVALRAMRDAEGRPMSWTLVAKRAGCSVSAAQYWAHPGFREHRRDKVREAGRARREARGYKNPESREQGKKQIQLNDMAKGVQNIVADSTPVCTPSIVPGSRQECQDADA